METIMAYGITQRITVRKTPRNFKPNSKARLVWFLINRSKTVGQYLQLRKSFGLTGLGGYFGHYIATGAIQVQ
jgi:hypothetical protein